MDATSSPGYATAMRTSARALLLALLAGCSAPATRRDAADLFVPTPVDIVRFMLSQAKVSQEDVLYDLGSGDGHIVRIAARDFRCRAVGIEIDLDMVKSSRELVALEGYGDRVRIEHGDVLKADLREASVVTLYLGERLNRQLLPTLRRLRAGTRIVSHNYPLPGVTADLEESMVSKEDKAQHAVFVYVCPLREN